VAARTVTKRSLIARNASRHSYHGVAFQARLCEQMRNLRESGATVVSNALVVVKDDSFWTGYEVSYVLSELSKRGKMMLHATIIATKL